jgi:hypothetical protein
MISIFMHNELIMKLKGHHKYITGIVFSPQLNKHNQLFSWCMSKWIKNSMSIQMLGGGNALAGETKVQFHKDK